MAVQELQSHGLPCMHACVKGKGGGGGGGWGGNDDDDDHDGGDRGNKT